MKYLFSVSLLACFYLGFGQQMTIYRSQYSVEETVDKIVQSINQNNLIHFETVYHDLIAKDYGIRMAPTRTIIFEDPTMNVELVACRQTTALDLPLKILVWEENEDIYIGFFDPKLMKKRFMLQECNDIIRSLSRLKIRIVNDVIKEG